MSPVIVDMLLVHIDKGMGSYVKCLYLGGLHDNCPGLELKSLPFRQRGQVLYFSDLSLYYVTFLF